MMESQKKAAEEAEAAENMLAAVASTSSSSSSAAPAVAVPEPAAVHAPASASIQHEDFNDDSSDDDSDSNGIAFLSAAVGATKKGKAAPKGKANGAGAQGSSRASNSTAAAAAAVMSLQRMHWTKEMVRFSPLLPLYPFFLRNICRIRSSQNVYRFRNACVVSYIYHTYLNRMRCCCTSCLSTTPRTG